VINDMFGHVRPDLRVVGTAGARFLRRAVLGSVVA
jgi:nucleotide-binding universal stress UspA family protein